MSALEHNIGRSEPPARRRCDVGRRVNASRDARRAWSQHRAVLVALLALTSVATRAHAEDCNGLYAAIQAADDPGRSANGSNGGEWGRAAAQQRREIDRTQRYADQLGCDTSGGLFGDDPPAQCGTVMDRLQRMQENLASIQAQSTQGVAEDDRRRTSLIARYNAACIGVGGGNPGDLAQRSDRGLLGSEQQATADPRNDPFGNDDLSTVPLNGDISDGGDGTGAARGQAICVRTCDGGYFPLAPHAHEDQLDGLEQLCQASCPNTEAKLYTMGRSGDLGEATAVDGSSYTALPSAFKFEKSFAPTCTCKPPNQSWAEALAQAETLLGEGGRHDVTVTATLSEQMARPAAAPPPKGKAGRIKGQKSLPVPAPLPDPAAARDAQKAMQGPTASNDTTGIGGPVQPERVVRAGDGPTLATTGPDGAKKRIRLIVP